MFRRSLILATAFLALAGCFPEGNKGGNNLPVELSLDSKKALVIAATSPDYQTSDMLILAPDGSGGFELRQEEFSTTNPSDIVVSSYSNNLYRLNRGLDSITGYGMTSSGQINLSWNYSVLGDDESANPNSLVADTATRGFVARYNS